MTGTVDDRLYRSSDGTRYPSRYMDDQMARQFDLAIMAVEALEQAVKDDGQGHRLVDLGRDLGHLADYEHAIRAALRHLRMVRDAWVEQDELMRVYAGEIEFEGG